MKKYLNVVLVMVLSIFFAAPAKSQFYQIANQLPGLIGPALSSSLSYQGSVDVTYLNGIGSKRANFVGISTSQGFRYRKWFYMGVGLGVDMIMTHTSSTFSKWNTGWGAPPDTSLKTRGVMVPVFTDFRFNIGNSSSATFFIDARIGASFLMGNSYMAVDDGYLSSREYFYLKPTAGVQILLGDSGRKALNVGVAYQLLTSNYYYFYTNNIILNSLGASVSFEW